MTIFNLLTFVGGLALFLYGINVMGDGLKKTSGGKLEGILAKLTSNKITAVLIGTLVTALMQSSSATTVMIVGFVNSGLMELAKSVHVIMGANIGATITPWVMSLSALGSGGTSIFLQLLKPTSFAPILAIIGVFIIIISKNTKKKNVALIFVGFAVLMFGMDTMSGAVEPLADSAEFANVMMMFSNPILGTLVGVVLTGIIQSSSATVGMVQVLSTSGLITYGSAIPLMIGANIGKFLNDVALLIDQKKTTDVLDITNQSNKDGIRIVFELRKDANPQNFINLLYKKTRLEDTFGFNMLAICDGRPETLSLKRVIEENVKFQFEICTRKYTRLLEKEVEKKEIQEGLIRAVNIIDLIIEILRGSKDRNMAKACMMEGKTEGIKFKSKESKIMAAQLDFTEKQANAILDMRLYKLIGLELNALFDENEETLANIAKYTDILEHKDSMSEVIIADMEALKAEFKRERRTVIEDAEEIVLEEKAPEIIDITFLCDRFGYAKTVDSITYERNKEAADSENKYIFNLKSDGKVCIFTDIGNVYTIKAKDLPFGKFRDKGQPLDNVSNYDSSKERILCIASVEDIKYKQLCFVSSQSLVKLTEGVEFDVSKKTCASTKLNDGDSLVSVCVINDQKNIVMQTKDGVFLRFAIDEIPEKKKAAAGVRGMKLSKGDSVEEVYYTTNSGDNIVTYNDKPFDLMAKVKPGHRDSKGIKIRS